MNEQPEQARIRLSGQIRHRAVGAEGVLVHLANGRVLVVNEVGLHIVSQLGSACTHQDLAASIVEAFDASPEQATADLEIYLAELDAEQVLEHV